MERQKNVRPPKEIENKIKQMVFSKKVSTKKSKPNKNKTKAKKAVVHNNN